MLLDFLYYIYFLHTCQFIAEVCGGEAAEVVLRGHHFAVGTDAAEGDEVAAAGRGGVRPC